MDVTKALNDGGPGNDSIETDEVFDILSSERRRLVIVLLDEYGPLNTGDLAEMVASHEYNTDVSDVSAKQRKRVYVSLHQCHMPKLVQDDAVEEVARGYRLTENADDLVWYITHGPDTSVSDWVRNFLG